MYFLRDDVCGVCIRSAVVEYIASVVEGRKGSLMGFDKLPCVCAVYRPWIPALRRVFGSAQKLNPLNNVNGENEKNDGELV